MCLAIPAKIKSIDHNTALVDFGDVSRKISLGIISGAKKNDYVLVHAGFAIGKIGRQEAIDTIRAIQELNEVMREK
ncbi:MAG: HypC/HybG/HupF family hydrogenase formation chaperone [bacterium]